MNILYTRTHPHTLSWRMNNAREIIRHRQLFSLKQLATQQKLNMIYNNESKKLIWQQMNKVTDYKCVCVWERESFFSLQTYIHKIYGYIYLMQHLFNLVKLEENMWMMVEAHTGDSAFLEKSFRIFKRYSIFSVIWKI